MKARAQPLSQHGPTHASRNQIEPESDRNSGSWARVPLMRRTSVVIVILALAVAAFAGCGDDTKVVTDTLPNGKVTTQTVPDIHFAKTKFLLHSGLAFGAFHRYIYKPFREGKFRSGADGRRTALVKAGLAGLFASHELKVARNDALASDTLRKHLVRPMDALLVRLKSLASSLKGGSFDPSSITGAAAAVTALSSVAAQAGVNIKDRSAPVSGI